MFRDFPNEANKHVIRACSISQLCPTFCNPTGLLLALCLPSSLPIWMAVIGCFVAIVVVKQMFGGLGNNFVNPVACARAVLLVSFPFYMSTYYTPFLDATASATPLASTDTSFKELFFGTHAGSIGETSVAMLLIGGLYLFIRGVIKPTIPLAFIGSVAAITYAFGGNGLTAICSGGLILGAIFMATDYVTSPTTFIGKIIFGIGCGTFTFIIRSGNAAEGVCFAILFMNLLVPYIDKLSSLVTSRWEVLKK